MEAELSVKKNCVDSTDPETDFDSFLIYDLVKKLKENAVSRGESWHSFVLNYERGGSVKTNFKY